MKKWLEVLDTIGLKADINYMEWDWTIGLNADMNCDMEWNDVELETGEVYVGRNCYVEVAGKVLDTTGLKADVNYDIEWDWT